MKALQEREQQARVEATNAALQAGQSGNLGSYGNAHVSLRFRAVKPTSPRIKEIEEEIEYLHRTAAERLRTNDAYFELKTTIDDLKDRLEAHQASLDDMVLGRDLLEELEVERARCLGEKQPEIVVRFR